MRAKEVHENDLLSHQCSCSEPDDKIAPERLMSRSISPSQNRLLKHLTDKRHRRHDHAVAEFAYIEFGAA